MQDCCAHARGRADAPTFSAIRFAAGLLAIALMACHTASTPTDTSPEGQQSQISSGLPCQPGHAGCPCAPQSAPVACGQVTQRSGSFVTCSMGTSSCENGQWSACTGATIVTKSLHPESVGASGIRTLSTTFGCPDAGPLEDECDPGCMYTASSAADVDASTIAPSGNGVTIALPSAGDGGCVGLQCQVVTNCPLLQWFSVNMMAPQTFSEIVLDNSTGSTNDYPRQYQVFVSSDGTDWGNPIASGAGTSSVVTITFPTQTYQYIRITSNGSSSYWWSIVEMNVYGPNSDGGVNPDGGLTALSRTGWLASASMLGDTPQNAIDGNTSTRWTTGNWQQRNTAIFGTVMDPAGRYPVNNATVYIPTDPSAPLPPMPTGASCGACPQIPSAVVVAQTGPDGTFELQNAPTTDVAPGTPVPLVVQAGKWRREAVLPPVAKCNNTFVNEGLSRLPVSSTDSYTLHADVPKMAIATGADDPFECLLLKMGIPSSEFQLPGSGAKRIDYYRANGVDFSSPAPGLASLVGGVSSLLPYDAVLLPCEGFEDDATNAYADNVAAYANAGGRVLTTHFSYSWLATPTAGMANATNPSTNAANPFYGVATWDLNATPTPPTSIPMTIDTTSAQGQGLSQWMLNVPYTAPLTANPGYHDVTSVVAPTAQWSYATASNAPVLFSFNAPVPGTVAPDASTAACGSVTYSDFHTTSASDLITAGACTSGTQCASGECGDAGACTLLFPTSCSGSAMTDQEKVLEYALLDMTKCLQPVPAYSSSATFTEVFQSTCGTNGTPDAGPSGTHVQWQVLDWFATVPPTSSISFAVQTGDYDPEAGAPVWEPAVPLPLVTVTTSNPYPLLAEVGIDTGTTGPIVGVFNTQMPPIRSGDYLRLTVTLNPTSDGTAAPVLNQWFVKSVCAASE